MSLSVFAGCDDGSTVASSGVSSAASNTTNASTSSVTSDSNTSASGASDASVMSDLTASDVSELLSNNTGEGQKFSVPEDDYIIPPETNDDNLYYYYNCLSESLRDAYCRLTAAIANCEMTCQLASAPTEEELSLLYTCITFDQPQFFHIYAYEQANHFTYSPSDKSVIYIMYDFQISETNAAPDIDAITEYYNQIQANIKEPIEEAQKYKSTYDQISYLYYWLVDGTQISWSDHNEHPHSTIKELLIDKHGVCIGYALTLSYLYRQLGIVTTIGSGINSSNVQHTWCIAKVDGKYYACDAYFGNEHRVNFEHSSAEYLLMENYDTEEKMQVTPYAIIAGPTLG